MRVRLPEGPAGARALLAGQAVTVMRAELCEAALPGAMEPLMNADKRG